MGNSAKYKTIMQTCAQQVAYPLFNAFYIWEILQNIKPLCKHAHNKWHMDSELVVKFWLHKNQHKKALFIFHSIYYLYQSQFNQFHILGNYKQMFKMLWLDTTLWSKNWYQNVEPCTLLHSTSLSDWTCPIWLSRSPTCKTSNTKVSTPSTN